MKIWKVLKKGSKQIKKLSKILSLLILVGFFVSGCKTASGNSGCIPPLYYDREDQIELKEALDTMDKALDVIERRLIEYSNQNEKLRRLNE